MLQSIYSLVPLIVAVLFISTVIELMSTQYFYGSLFRWGIPIVKRKITLLNPQILLPIGDTIEKQQAVYKFIDADNIYFRTSDHVFFFQNAEPILMVKLTANINREQKQVSVVARMYLAVTLMAAIVCLFIACVAISTIGKHFLLGTILLLALIFMLFKFRSWYNTTIIKIDLMQAELLTLLDGLSTEVPQQDYQ